MSTASQVVSIAVGLVVFVGAVAGLVRAIGKSRDSTRENTTATRANTEKIADLITRYDALDHRVVDLEYWRQYREGGAQR